MKKNYSFKKKLSQLSQGDTAFENEMLRLYKESFQDIKENFRLLMLNRKTDQLAFMTHKYRTTLIMFDLDELASDLEESKRLAKETTLDKKRIEEVATRIEAQCVDILLTLAAIS